MVSRWSDTERDGYVAVAERGSVAAQMWLGWAYWEGKFLDLDLEAAQYWLKRAASSNDGEALYRYALFCRSVGDADSAGTLLTAVVAERCPAAAYELGNHYFFGLAVSRDEGRGLVSGEKLRMLGTFSRKFS